MTWHDISQLTTLPHLTSPHNQPHYFIAPCNQPHQNRSPHHHHGTAEGSFTQTTRFGHRSRWSPCAHSIGKFFLWLIVFLLGNFRPRLARLYLYIHHWWKEIFTILKKLKKNEKEYLKIFVEKNKNIKEYLKRILGIFMFLKEYKEYFLCGALHKPSWIHLKYSVSTITQKLRFPAKKSNNNRQRHCHPQKTRTTANHRVTWNNTCFFCKLSRSLGASCVQVGTFRVSRRALYAQRLQDLHDKPETTKMLLAVGDAR